MNFFKIIDLMIIFIVIYLLAQIGRVFVLPHLKVFPNIPPQWLWTSIVGIIFAIGNAIFHYIIMFLIIVYILWLIIRKFVPNFPIPFKKILLRLPPFYPLAKAGILPLMDNVRKILFSKMPVPERVTRAGNALGMFIATSTAWVFRKFGLELPKPNANSNSQSNSTKTSEPDSTYTEEENREIQESYLQCVEQTTVPITPEMPSSEKASLGLKNQQNILICKVNMMQTYSDILTSKLKK